jgi:hypothetical protein
MKDKSPGGITAEVSGDGQSIELTFPYRIIIGAELSPCYSELAVPDFTVYGPCEGGERAVIRVSRRNEVKVEFDKSTKPPRRFFTCESVVVREIVGYQPCRERGGFELASAEAAE